jgi:hypothetical protein
LLCSFEDLVVYLRDKQVIATTKSCLWRIHQLVTSLHGSPANALAPDYVNVRVFLAGFMIAFRPTHVFESMGQLEQSLYESALPLMTRFQSIVEHIVSRGSFQQIPADLTHDFLPMIFEYLRRFNAWKVPDEAKLVCRIKHALVALYQAQQQLPLDEPDDSKLKVELITQIERLRSKLSKIAGSKSLAQFDAGRAAGSDIPSVSNANVSHTTLPGRLSNEQLAHELLLDPTFQLDDFGGSSAENPVAHRIRESFHQVAILSSFCTNL